MKLADTLAYGMSTMPTWLGSTLLRMNFLKESMFGPAMKKFKAGIPAIDPEQRLVDMANYAIGHVPYYRDRYRGLVVKDAEHFSREFDFIDKKTVMAAPERFVSDVARDYVRVSTSGTTGTPLKLLIPADRHVTEMAFVTRAWQRVGWNFGPRARIRLGSLPRGRKYLVNPFTKEYIFDSAFPDDDYIRLIHRTLEKNKVDTLYSYSMHGYILLKRFERLGLDTSVIKRALLTSEPVTAAQYDYIHGKLGIAISSYYGHTEKLIFAYSLNGHDSFVIEPAYGYCEIIGADSRVCSAEGETGEMVGSTFYNFAMPLLRYRTGDNATLGATMIDDDGVTKRILSSIEGRPDNLVVFRHDGSRVSQSNFVFHGPELAHIDGLQFVQDKRGYLRVLYQPNRGFTESDRMSIERRVESIMLGRQYFTMEKVDEFILTPSGKFLLVVNKTL